MENGYFHPLIVRRIFFCEMQTDKTEKRKTFLICLRDFGRYFAFKINGFRIVSALYLRQDLRGTFV